MLVLYHFGGAICAQKVRLALSEKDLTWESRDCIGLALRDPEYLKLNPNGVVPTLVHDDRVLTESRIISEYIDDAFAGPALTPADPYARYHARLWSKQIDDGLHLNVFILSFAIGFREVFLQMPPDVRATALPGLRDPIKRRISQDLLEHGWESHWLRLSANRFRRLAEEMEVCLARSPYLAGSDYSLADADYTAYLNRLIDLGLSGLWADKPAVAAWWERVKERPSYKSAIVDWTTPADIDRYSTSRARYAAEIGQLLTPSGTADRVA